ncbi:MAG: HAD-IIIC family phosphatase [Clostridia bacterium]|nr:HAD-IIIC family phosphatase [Clostridia bacterium]
MEIKRANAGKIKCLIFDLDDTLWEGTLTEGGAKKLRAGAAELIRTLDSRGILMSIASKNDHDSAMDALRRLDPTLPEMFLCPKISWGTKSSAIKEIAEDLNLKMCNLAFIDDSEFQRDEVKFVHPDISVYDASELTSLADYPEFTVRFITEDSKNRRNMYVSDMTRDRAKAEFDGTDEAFMSTLDMRLSIDPVDETQLRRVEELTLRTHQLNSTGYTYSYEELCSFIDSDKHEFYIAGLTDKYGDSGKVGLLLMEDAGDAYVLKLLIVSCRVMTRGVGTALLTHAVRIAAARGKKLRAEYLETEYNRIMYITYKLAGFDEICELDDGEGCILEYAREALPEYPSYLNIVC